VEGAAEGDRGVDCDCCCDVVVEGVALLGCWQTVSSTSFRHTGHVLCNCSHGSMQGVWNI